MKLITSQNLQDKQTGRSEVSYWAKVSLGFLRSLVGGGGGVEWERTHEIEIWNLHYTEGVAKRCWIKVKEKLSEVLVPHFHSRGTPPFPLAPALHFCSRGTPSIPPLLLLYILTVNFLFCHSISSVENRMSESIFRLTWDAALLGSGTLEWKDHDVKVSVSSLYFPVPRKK